MFRKKGHYTSRKNIGVMERDITFKVSNMYSIIMYAEN